MVAGILWLCLVLSLSPSKIMVIWGMEWRCLEGPRVAVLSVGCGGSGYYCGEEEWVLGSLSIALCVEFLLPPFQG